MKTKVIITSLAVMAMLMPAGAMARDSKSRPMNIPRHRTELRMVANRRPGMATRVAHRPSIGARFERRPVHGRFININRERLWLADGILYRVMPTPHGVVYVVVGYR